MQIGKLAIQFVKELAIHMANGMVTVDPPTYVMRLHHCKKCPHLSPELKCGLCGCTMTVKAKWASTSCPDNPKKWTRDERRDKGHAPAAGHTGKADIGTRGASAQEPGALDQERAQGAA